jgi:hypothetical protein
VPGGVDLSLGQLGAKPLIITISTIFLLIILYILARPLLYYDNNTYRQQGLTSAAKLVGRLPDDKFDPSRVDAIVAQINPPVIISVGAFATAKIPITVHTIVATSPAHPPTEVWLRGANWTENAFLTVGADAPLLQYNWDFIILAMGSIIVAVVGIWSFYKPSNKLETSVTGLAPLDGNIPDVTEQYMAIDVQRALATSEQLFSRSTLLLVSGVVMAFVGVGVFFLSPFTNDPASAPIQSFVDLLSSLNYCWPLDLFLC